MAKVGKGPGGRPPTLKKDKLTQPVFVILTATDRKKIDRLTRIGEFKSRSQILRLALREWLKRRETAEETETAAE